MLAEGLGEKGQLVWCRALSGHMSRLPTQGTVTPHAAAALAGGEGSRPSPSWASHVLSLVILL